MLLALFLGLCREMHVATADPVPCAISEWEPWAPCESGQRQRARRVIALEGEPWCHGFSDHVWILKETEACIEDCIFSEWQDWGPGPEDGQRLRERYILKHARHGGERCRGDLQETAPSFSTVASEARRFDGLTADCELSAWSFWTACSQADPFDDSLVTQKERARKIKVPPSGGGRPCEAALLETEECGRRARNRDCKFDGWSDWEPAPRVGALQRSRNIKEFASGAGRCCSGPLEMARPSLDSYPTTGAPPGHNNLDASTWRPTAFESYRTSTTIPPEILTTAADWPTTFPPEFLTTEADWPTIPPPGFLTTAADWTTTFPPEFLTARRRTGHWAHQGRHRRRRAEWTTIPPEFVTTSADWTTIPPQFMATAAELTTGRAGELEYLTTAAPSGQNLVNAPTMKPGRFPEPQLHLGKHIGRLIGEHLEEAQSVFQIADHMASLLWNGSADDSLDVVSFRANSSSQNHSHDAIVVNEIQGHQAEATQRTQEFKGKPRKELPAQGYRTDHGCNKSLTAAKTERDNPWEWFQQVGVAFFAGAACMAFACLCAPKWRASPVGDLEQQLELDMMASDQFVRF
eukprot:TRINITY_DN22162_c0_g1_i1.p1 TRINITY_DN22162_c0_g1~~TRINITY_DN22162_c0_g1_i1.p1  ORF type:complete len:578 (-),score=81.09 TRINITY_DN22162_c0_g1_i1:48-1781(-)